MEVPQKQVVSNAILRTQNVMAAMGLSRSSYYAAHASGLITDPIKISGGRAAGLPVYEVEALNAARISGKTDAEIRNLVEQLHAQRKTASSPVVAPR